MSEYTAEVSIDNPEAKVAASSVRQGTGEFEDSGKQYLSEIEALRLELSLSKLQVIEKTKQTIQTQLQLEERGVQIEQLMLKDKLHVAHEKIKSLRSQLENLSNEASAQKDTNLSLIRQISEAHNLGEKKFGYNPETLEIVLND